MFVAPDDFLTAANVLRAESPDDARRQEAFRARVLSADKADCSFHTADQLANHVRDAMFNHLRAVRAPPPPAPFTVPAPVADFQGREDEIATVEGALTGNGRAVISALSGMGGIGQESARL